MLISVLLVGMLTFVITIGISTRSLHGLDGALGEESSSVARMLAESCIEHALFALKQNPEYLGGETIARTLGSCSIFPVIQLPSGDKEVTAESTVGGYDKKISVIATTSPFFRVVSWGAVVP